MGKARALAEMYPEIVLCIDHAGFPRSREPEYFERWKAGMNDIAGAPNAVCKVSGLGMCDNAWTSSTEKPARSASATAKILS